MKRKLLIASFILVLPLSVMAQEFLDLVKTEINFEKRALVSQSMEISSVESPDFWNIYTNFENELNTLTDRRAANIKKFFDNYDNMTDKIASELASTYFSVKSDRNKIYKKYHKKFKGVVGEKRAVRLIQVMDQIQLLIDLQIASESPLIK